MKKVYRQTAAYARANGEMGEWRDSRNENMECRDAIDQIIKENFDGFRLAPRIENEILERFGAERVAYVLANTIKQMSYDGRFETDNKDWAATIPVTREAGTGYDRNLDMLCRTHPAVMDGFVRRMRKALESVEMPVPEKLEQKCVAEFDAIISKNYRIKVVVPVDASEDEKQDIAKQALERMSQSDFQRKAIEVEGDPYLTYEDIEYIGINNGDLKEPCESFPVGTVVE